MTTTTNFEGGERTAPTPISYILRIGVTGHRRLPDEAAIREAVEHIVQRIESTLAHSAEHPRGKSAAVRGFWDQLDFFLLHCVRLFWWRLPVTPRDVGPNCRVPIRWSVVSCLAEGADRIVADVLIDQKSAELHAVLPFDSGIYEQDFDTDHAREAFTNYLNRADAQWTAPGNNSHDMSKTERRNGYRLASERMVNECDILIAIWDGGDGEGAGGTADTVDYARRRGVPVVWIKSTAPSDAPQFSTTETDAQFVTDSRFLNAKSIAPRYHQLCAYYRDPGFDRKAYASIYKRESAAIEEAAARSGIDTDARSGVMERRFPQYVYADQLAQRHQTIHLRSTIAIVAFAAAAVTVAAVHLLILTHEYWLILIEIAFMIVAAVLLRVSRRERWHEKWLYDRYLAERLRCLMCRDLVAGEEDGTKPTHELLPFYDAPAAWVDAVILQTAARTADCHRKIPVEPLKQFLSDAWIASQAEWHRRTSKKKKRAEHRIHRTTLALFFATLICAILHLLHIGEHGSFIEMEWLPYTLKVLAVSLPAWGGAVHAIAHLIDYGRMAKRYERMGEQLDRLNTDLARSTTLEEIQDVARRADQLMAMENLEWMMTLAHHKPELHV